MKKYILTILVALVSIATFACTPPSGHCVVNLGADYYLNNLKDYENGTQNIGITGFLGYETSNRYNVLGANFNYVFGTKYWSVGGEYHINPLGIEWGYDTPVNIAFIIGCGYRSTKNVYGDLGLELSGNMGTAFTWFIADKVGRDFQDRTWHNECSLGIRLWLGKRW